MTSPDHNTETASPCTNGATTPTSGPSVYDNIRVLRSTEKVDSLHSKLEDEPLKFKRKLRTLSSKLAPPLDGGLQTIIPIPVVGEVQSKVVKHRSPQLRQIFTTQTSSKLGPTTGGMNDPIDVDALKSRSPHKFRERPAAYFAPVPLRYRPSRPKRGPRIITPNGAVVESGKIGSGHQSHDIYKAFAAKKPVVPPPDFGHLAAQMRCQIGRPAPQEPNAFTYGLKSPSLGRPLYANGTNPYQSAPYPRPAPTTHVYPYQPFTATYKTPVNGYPIFRKQDESELRKRAVQHIRGYSRPRPRKRRLSDDPDETSDSESENVSTPSTGASEEAMFDRNAQITELVEHTQLVTAMLMTYPFSEDHKGLREDLSMLMSVSRKRFEAWLVGEDEIDSDTGKRQRLWTGVTSPSPDPKVTGWANRANLHKKSGVSEVTALTKKMVGMQQQQARDDQRQRQREVEMRSYLSTHSDFWTTLEGEDAMRTTMGLPAPVLSELAVGQSTISPGISEASPSLPGSVAKSLTRSRYLRPILPKTWRSISHSDPVPCSYKSVQCTPVSKKAKASVQPCAQSATLTDCSRSLLPSPPPPVPQKFPDVASQKWSYELVPHVADKEQPESVSKPTLNTSSKERI